MNELMADMENFVNTQRECPSSSDESSADGEDDDEDQENKIEEQTNQTTRATDVAGVHAPLADISNFPLTQDTADAAASLLSLVNKPPRPAAVPLETTTPPRLQHPSETVSTNNSSSDSTSFDHFQDDEILNLDLSTLAKEIHTNTAGTDWTEEEFTMIQDSSENSTGYTKRKRKTWDLMLSVVALHSGDKLKSLVTEKKLLPGSHIMAPLLVHELRNPTYSKEAKVTILDECLKIFVKRHMDKSNKNGKLMEPGSMQTYVKHISSMLNDFNVDINIWNDIPKTNSFKSLASQLMSNKLASNAKYGTLSNQAPVDVNADNAIIAGIRDGRIKLSDPLHLSNVFMYTLQEAFALRSGGDAEKATFAQVKVFRIESGTNQGKNQLDFTIPWDKSNKPKLGNKKISTTHTLSAIQNDHDDLNVVNVYLRYELLVPKEDRNYLFVKPATKKKMKEFELHGLPYKFDVTKKQGPNTLKKCGHFLGTLLGYEPLLNYKGHSYRRTSCTVIATATESGVGNLASASNHLRHKDIQTTAGYVVDTDKSINAHQQAMISNRTTVGKSKGDSTYYTNTISGPAIHPSDAAIHPSVAVPSVSSEYTPHHAAVATTAIHSSVAARSVPPTYTPHHAAVATTAIHPSVAARSVPPTYTPHHAAVATTAIHSSVAARSVPPTYTPHHSAVVNPPLPSSEPPQKSATAPAEYDAKIKQMETEIERVNRRYSVERDNRNYYESKNYNKKRDIEKLEDDKKTLQLDIEKLKRVNEKLEDDLRSEKRKFEASEDSNKRLKCAVDDTARTINRLREELFDTVRHNNRNQHCIIM